jgi:hypothetical protein
MTVPRCQINFMRFRLRVKFLMRPPSAQLVYTACTVSISYRSCIVLLNIQMDFVTLIELENGVSNILGNPNTHAKFIALFIIYFF